MCRCQAVAAAVNGLLFAVANGIAAYAYSVLGRWPSYGAPDGWAAFPEVAWLVTPVGIAYLVAPLSVLFGLFGVGLTVMSRGEVRRCGTVSVLCLITGVALLVDPTGAVEWFVD